ncbi:hypothetical protein N781_03020 [Pontibacillus halophilus JSM 076056 = DSM 19796]|uniref:AraC family transcriptional regulator n=1 Tax=Pontibacillus halophilus JSM 076056 = DSM 19796 TaxID=1385510 RepID=A0A0A5I8C1_9BACI|nr:helix-turn-helix domain-containing protein [Pontibacillus halophilus]KGX92077.1 hypothetical protein N781_03020 [Pontibacillus halophilus JSM 076056 = DSM 19796]
MYTLITVDDEKLVKRSMAALIEEGDCGFTLVGEAKNGEEGLTLACNVQPDLIITDIRMPKLDGLAFIERALHEVPNCSFIVISGYDEFSYAQRALRYGVSDFLLKPIHPEQFLEALQKVKNRLDEQQEHSSNRDLKLSLIQHYGDVFVEELWLLNEDSCYQKVNEFHQQLGEDIASTHLQYYDDLLRYTIERLNKRGTELSQYSFRDEIRKEGSLAEALKEVFKNILHHLKVKRNVGRRTHILEAVEYIQTHFHHEDISLQSVADRVQMSPAYFSMEFKKEMGITFKQYVTQKRMNRARQLLEDPTYKTYEVAFAIGYGDYPHFTKTFKKCMGLTPTEYRKRLGAH